MVKEKLHPDISTESAMRKQKQKSSLPEVHSRACRVHSMSISNPPQMGLRANVNIIHMLSAVIFFPSIMANEPLNPARFPSFLA